MTELLVLIIIIFIILMSLKMHTETQSAEVDYVESMTDQRQYLVRNLPDKKQAAEMLSQIRQNLERLLQVLKQKYPTDSRTQRLEQKVNLDNISEGAPHSAYTSYSVNKGEKIVFCLRQRDPSEQLLDLNTMTFVAIHEMAHIMTVSVGHTEEFWNNMKFLLGLAMSKDVSIYQYQDYQKAPKSYCGITISDTPLKL